MLIEAQAQKLLSEHQKTKDDDDSQKDPLAMETDEPEKTESDNTDVQMMETESKPPEEPDKKSEADEKVINIDPKTYCKLGHFHLLLEDYTKGKCRKWHSY